MIEHAYVAFGSNVGSVSPRDAIAELEKRGISVIRSAVTYETSPAEGVTGGKFVNTVFECERAWNPEIFLEALQDVELALGSRVNKQMRQRSCDLDLLLWGFDTINEPNLQVPHVRMHLRDFVLAPLCDLIPDEPLPVLSMTPRDLLSKLTVRHIIRSISE